MKIIKQDKKSMIATLRSIREEADIKGCAHIIICCDGDLYFTAYKRTFDKIGLPISELEEGDKIRVTYVEKPWNGKLYKNFINVEFVERPAVAKELAARKDEVVEGFNIDDLYDELEQKPAASGTNN